MFLSLPTLSSSQGQVAWEGTWDQRAWNARLQDRREPWGAVGKGRRPPTPGAEAPSCRPRDSGGRPRQPGLCGGVPAAGAGRTVNRDDGSHPSATLHGVLCLSTCICSSALGFTVTPAPQRVSSAAGRRTLTREPVLLATRHTASEREPQRAGEGKLRPPREETPGRPSWQAPGPGSWLRVYHTRQPLPVRLQAGPPQGGGFHRRPSLAGTESAGEGCGTPLALAPPPQDAESTGPWSSVTCCGPPAPLLARTLDVEGGPGRVQG